jgi:hypothetical protein
LVGKTKASVRQLPEVTAVAAAMERVRFIFKWWWGCCCCGS